MGNQRKQLKQLRAQYERRKAPDELTERMENIMKKVSPEKSPNRALRYSLRTAAALAASFVVLAGVTNISAFAAASLTKVPVLGAIVKVITFRAYVSENGAADITTPHIEGLNDSALQKALNDKFDAYADTLIAQYESDVDQYANGNDFHSAVYADYAVLVNNDRQLTLAVHTEYIAGDSVEIVNYYTVDKQNGKLLSLAGLFQDKTDYVTPISASILAQMKTRMAQNDEDVFNIDPQEDPDAFTKIAADQQFYINTDGKLVISFNEGDVGSYSMGTITFVIPTDTIADILADKGLIAG